MLHSSVRAGGCDSYIYLFMTCNTHLGDAQSKYSLRIYDLPAWGWKKAWAWEAVSMLSSHKS